MINTTISQGNYPHKKYIVNLFDTTMVRFSISLHLSQFINEEYDKRDLWKEPMIIKREVGAISAGKWLDQTHV